jgi:hypothetical protein
MWLKTVMWLSTDRGNYASTNKAPHPSPLPRGANVIKLSIRALILEETLLKKGFFQALFPKLLKVLGKGFKGKTLFQKGFPLNLMTLSPEGRGRKRLPLCYLAAYLTRRVLRTVMLLKTVTAPTT